MKTRVIKSIIEKKFNEFVSSITDEGVRDLVRQNTIITGGAIASMLLNEEVNDFDMYFTNIKTAEAVANYYVEQYFKNKNLAQFKDGRDIKVEVQASGDRVQIFVKSAGVLADGGIEDYEYFELGDPVNTVNFFKKIKENVSGSGNGSSYRPVYITSNAITLSDDVQLVMRFVGEPEQIHGNYDFVHCTNYWSSKNDELVLNPKALECLLTKELRYIGSRYPIASIIRIRKFLERGYTITAGQILKICTQISELDLHNPLVLQDQLTGVDVAYFNEVLTKIKSSNPEEIDFAYLSELIDEVM